MISLQVLRPVLVIDNTLTSTSTTNAASANTAKQLKDLVDIKSDINSPTFSGTPSAPNPLSNDNTTRIATCNFVQNLAAGIEGSAVATANAYSDSVSSTAETNAKSYADGLVIGLLDDRGNYNPTVTSLYPTTGGSGVAGAILKGDLWTISYDGNVNGIAVTTGDTVRALVDAPGQNNANWAITQNNLIYVPENSSNKATSLASPDNTKYPTTQAIATALEGYATIANQRYQFLNDETTTGTTYIVPASAVTENSRTIIELSNNSLTSITINTATGTGKVAGDSVNISITGTYAAQVLVASGVTLQGDLTFSYQYQTKTLIYKGSNVWKIVG